MSKLQDGLDEHGRPIKEFDMLSMDSSTNTGRVSDLTLPNELLKAPPPSSRIRAFKPKPLSTRRTKKGTLELCGDIEAMKSVAVSELSMASPVQSAFPKSMRRKMEGQRSNNPESAPPPPRRVSSHQKSRVKPEIKPIAENTEYSFGKTSRSRPSGAEHRHRAPPHPKHREPGTKIDIDEVSQLLRAVQGQSQRSVNSGSESRDSFLSNPKRGGGGSTVASEKHSFVEGMKWRDKFGKPGCYSGDVNTEYIPHGQGAMHYDFGLTVEGRWVDGTLLNDDLDEGFAV
jgi:hypothetical protein